MILRAPSLSQLLAFLHSIRNAIILRLRRAISIRTARLFHEKWWLPLWQVIFALIAVADMASCLWFRWEERGESPSSDWNLKDRAWELLLRRSNQCPSQYTKCTTPRLRTSSFHVALSWTGPVFCGLCVIEAVLRAIDARRLALEMEALDKYEKRLARVYSTTRMSFSFLGGDLDHNWDEQTARSTIRTWIPVALVVVFWVSLLPGTLHQHCANDSSLATKWIYYCQSSTDYFINIINARIYAVLWHWILPFKLYQPIRFYRRLRWLLRWIRYLRFAGPLLRMGLKLWDQLWALSTTWRQTLTVQAEKAKRVAQRSLLVDDIRRLESLAKVHTALASLPSQLFHKAQVEMNVIGHRLAEKQKEGRQIQRRLRRLKADLARSFASTTDLYDRVVRMTRDLKLSMNDSLFSSHHLISPHSRFGVLWRVTVTNCLLLELFRLSTSWHLIGNFNLSLKQVFMKLVSVCRESTAKSNSISFLKLWKLVRTILPRLFPFALHPDEVEKCVPIGVLSRIIVWIGDYLESFIDIIGFLDIIVWFFTGELDANGLVIPKPFFSRCIMPGTLTQVLDHPTLPSALPAVLAKVVRVANEIGWGRAIRWALALTPAFILAIADPIKLYFFRQVDASKGLMFYAESCGIMAPSRTSTINLGSFDWDINDVSRFCIREGDEYTLYSDRNIPYVSRSSLCGKGSFSQRSVSVGYHIGNAPTLESPPSSPYPLRWHKTDQRNTSFANLDDSYRFSYLQY